MAAMPFCIFAISGMASLLIECRSRKFKCKNWKRNTIASFGIIMFVAFPSLLMTLI